MRAVERSRRQTYAFSGAAAVSPSIFLCCRIVLSCGLFSSPFLKQFIVFFSVNSAAIIGCSWPGGVGGTFSYNVIMLKHTSDA